MQIKTVVEARIVIEKRMYVEVVHGTGNFKLCQQRIRYKRRHEQAINDFHLLIFIGFVGMRLSGIDNKYVSGMNFIARSLEYMHAFAANHIDKLNELMPMLRN